MMPDVPTPKPGGSEGARPWPVQLFRFGLAGTAGFLVDAGSLLIYLGLAPGHFYSGRVISYVLAASTTWALNACFTFGAAEGSRLRQWGRFVLFNLGGGAVNYGVYAALIATMPLVAQMPLLAVAAGAVSGLGVNFVVSRKFVFTA